MSVSLMFYLAKEKASNRTGKVPVRLRVIKDWKKGWYDNGILQGEWYYWNREGDLTKKEVFKDNKLISGEDY